MSEQPAALDGPVLVERDVTIAAPREVVWACWTDPERLVRWMGKRAVLDLRPGGEVRSSMATAR